jgi:NAD(P)-dependent dehydrogenase (short-subunit alcohol dehydrogenase family)
VGRVNGGGEIRYDGQLALVTGAGRGLGRAHALAFGARGARVVVHDAGVEKDGAGGDPGVADAVVAEIRGAGGRAEAAYENLESADACRALIARVEADHGRLDVLVHNAGLVRFADLAGTDEAVWRRTMAVNVEAPFWLSRDALPLMRRRGYGRVVVTVSGYGFYPEYEQTDLAAYSVSKAALFGLMNHLAGEGAPAGVRVNAVSPVAATRIYRRAVPPGTLTPEQVTPGVLFLASARCDFSGVVLRAAGGRFGAGLFCRTEGVYLGEAPATPEALEARWAEVVAGLFSCLP